MPSNSMVAFRNLTFSYDNAAQTLISNLSVDFAKGFTGIVGANGTGKTTLLKLAAGDLAPNQGTVEKKQPAAFCAQRTDDPPALLADFLNSWDRQAMRLRGSFAIEDDALTRWHTLSHGERKRCQIAVALWQRPALLALDEPTNHIDNATRTLLLDNLKQYSDVGIIVSHDRDLLDELCTTCLWLEPPNVAVYHGNFTAARQQRAQARATTRQQQDTARRQHQHLQNELVRRREKAASEHRDRSKRGLSEKDHDAKEKINRAKLTDSKSGQPLRQLSGRAARAQSTLQSLQVTKEYNTGIWLTGATSKRKSLIAVEPGHCQFGDSRTLHYPRLDMTPTARIGLTGDNGSGKTTLINHLLMQTNLANERITFMPQEISRVAATRTLEEARALDAEHLGHLMNIVSRLGSRPARLLESANPSPGEIRKLMLALGMTKQPHLLILDEPTNHLDLPAIEALESALADCPCALLMVSHDQRFLDHLTQTRWHLAYRDPQHVTLSVQ